MQAIDLLWLKTVLIHPPRTVPSIAQSPHVHERREEHRDDDDAAEGKYTNYFKIGFNAVEFVLDLGQAYDDAVRELRHTRIVTTPTYAKALAELLLDTLARYETAHGPIPQLCGREPSRS
jgi:Protein of unknown function (DUF3467)